MREPGSNRAARVSFSYRNPYGRCFLDTKWGGCCCTCVYHGSVYKHCWHSPKKKKGSCVCGERLGFYVCTVFHTIRGQGYPKYGTRIHLAAEHGYCEMYEPVPNKPTTKTEKN